MGEASAGEAARAGVTPPTPVLTVSSAGPPYAPLAGARSGACAGVAPRVQPRRLPSGPPPIAGPRGAAASAAADSPAAHALRVAAARRAGGAGAAVAAPSPAALEDLPKAGARARGGEAAAAAAAWPEPCRGCAPGAPAAALAAAAAASWPRRARWAARRAEPAGLGSGARGGRSGDVAGVPARSGHTVGDPSLQGWDRGTLMQHGNAFPEVGPGCATPCCSATAAPGVSGVRALCGEDEAVCRARAAGGRARCRAAGAGARGRILQGHRARKALRHVLRPAACCGARPGSRPDRVSARARRATRRASARSRAGETNTLRGLCRGGRCEIRAAARRGPGTGVPQLQRRRRLRRRWRRAFAAHAEHARKARLQPRTRSRGPDRLPGRCLRARGRAPLRRRAGAGAAHVQRGREARFEARGCGLRGRRSLRGPRLASLRLRGTWRRPGRCGVPCRGAAAAGRRAVRLAACRTHHRVSSTRPAHSLCGV